MYERVGAIYPHHQSGILKKEILDTNFPEDVKALFEADELQCMFAGHMDGSFDECNCCESAAKLIDLR